MKGNLSKAPEHYGTVPTKLSELKDDVGYLKKTSDGSLTLEGKLHTNELDAHENLGKLTGDWQVQSPVNLKSAVNKEYVEKVRFEIERSISEIDGELSAASVYYDTIINDPQGFEAMIADDNWLGARNILLMCDVSIGYDPESSQALFPIPENVRLINACGHSIEGDYFTVYGNDKVVIENAQLKLTRCTISNFFGFYNCSICAEYEDYSVAGRLSNCRYIVGLTYTGDLNATGPFGFENCDEIWLTPTQVPGFNITEIGDAILHITENFPKYAKPVRFSQFYNDEGFVKKTEYAGIGRHGVVAVNYEFGVRANANGVLFTDMASNALIDEKLNEYNPIVPANLEYAVKSVGDGYYATEEQLGDIDAALDSIISIQEELIGDSDSDIELMGEGESV